MARTQQDIIVKIKALVEGLSNVRLLGKHIQNLAPAGAGGEVKSLTGDIDRLAGAVDRLAAASEKSSSKGGFVRFLVGANAVISGLATLPQAFEGLNKLLDFLDTIGGGVGSALTKVKGFFTSLFQSLSQFVGGAVARAGAAVEGLGGAAAGLGGAFAAALPVIGAVGVALGVVVGILAAATAGFIALAASAAVGALALLKIGPAGIEANSQLEQVKLGIAAVITSLAQLKVGGIPVEGAEKFRAAMQLSAAQVAKLRVDAVNTTATFEQIAPAFQSAIGPGLAAGLTLDQIRETTVKIVQAASAIGLPMDQVNQEVRAILDGTINEDARLAHIIGLTPQMVKDFKASGTLVEELNKRLEGFTQSGVEAAQTMDGLTSNLQEALNVFSTEATGRAFDALKREFARLLPQLFDFKSAGISQQFKALAELADEVLVRVIRIAGGIAQNIVAGLGRVSDFVRQNRAQIDAVLDQVQALIGLLVQAGGVIAGIATSSGVWGSTLEVVRGILMLINGVLALVLEQFRTMAPYLQLAIIAANALIASQFGVGGVPKPQEAPTGFSSVRLNPDGSLKNGIGVTASPASPAGGKGKGGGRKSKVPELQRGLDRATLDAELAEVQARFELIKQDIAASVDGIKNGLDDATLSIAEAYRLEAALADKALKAEKDRIDAEAAAAKKRRDLAVADLDPDLKPEERRLAIAAEDKKLLAESTRLEGERKRLVEETEDRKAALVRDEAKANKQLQDSLRDVETQLDSMSRSASVRADVAVREIEARFEETRRQLVANFGEASEQVKALDRLIAQLGQRATFQELTKNVEAKFGELRDLEELLSVGVESGQIRARDATRRRLELEREYKRVLLDEIEGLAEIARRTGDPELIAAVRKLQIEWSKLGVVINDTAKRIDDTLRGGLEDTLTNIITRTETVGEAFRKLAQTILAEIARILAVRFVDKLFGGILNTNAQGTSLGGILAKILGAGTPKTSGTPAPGGGGIENIPLVIKNFQGGAISNLTGIRGNTSGTVTELRDGFGGVGSKLEEVITFLPNLLPAGGSLLRDLVVKGIEIAGSVALKKATLPKAPKQPRAGGGFIYGPGTGTSDSILARLSNGEFVVREWAALMVGPEVLHFLNTFGRLPALVEAPAFALGGPVGGFTLAGINPPEGIGGDNISLNMPVTIQTPNPHAFNQSEQAIKRTVARAAEDGFRRAKSRPRV